MTIAKSQLEKSNLIPSPPMAIIKDISMEMYPMENQDNFPQNSDHSFDLEDVIRREFEIKINKNS